MKKVLVTIALLTFVAAAMGAAPPAAPATQPAKPLTIAELAAKIPKNLWPEDQRKQLQKFVQENLKGQRVAVTLSSVFTLTDGRIEGNGPKVSICGVDDSIAYYCVFAKKDRENKKGHKTTDSVTVVGEIQSIDPGIIVDEKKKKTSPHSVRLTNAEIVK